MKTAGAFSRLIDHVDRRRVELGAVAANNFRRWPMYRTHYDHPGPDFNFDVEVDYLKAFLQARFQWMDAEIAKL
jgi:hypothetical protein